MQLVPFFRLKATTEVDRDLAWYFQQSSAALGLSSNFATVIGAIQRGGGGGACGRDPLEVALRAEKAILRWRAVRQRLAGCSTLEQHVLEAAYEPRQWPRGIVKEFGPRLAGVAVRTESARDGFKDDSGKERARAESVAAWLAGVVVRKVGGTCVPRAERLMAERVVVEVRIEAEAALGGAYRAYDPTSGEDKVVRYAAVG